MSGRQITAAKYEAEEKFIFVDFANDMTSGETILSAAVTAAVYSGTDAVPEDIIDGSPSFAGTSCEQLIVAGEPGVQYLLTYAIGTSLGQTLVKQVYLSVLE